MTRKTNYSAFLYLFPLFLFLSTFIFFGIVYNVYISLFEWNGLTEKIFIGLDNYVQFISDTQFHNVLINTAIFTIVGTSVGMLLGFLFAVLLHGSRRGNNVFKAIFFVPNVMALIVTGVMFQMIYEPNFGILNQFLGVIGLDQLKYNWLADPNIALYAIIAVYIYVQAGFFMLIYYTSILNVNNEIFEAARMDGASLWTQYARIVFPLLTGTHITLSILGVIASLKIFDLVWVMTQGGPAGSTELLSTYLFRKSLLEFNMGYSAALSVVLLLIAFIYSAIQLKIYNKVGGAR